MVTELQVGDLVRTRHAHRGARLLSATIVAFAWLPRTRPTPRYEDVCALYGDTSKTLGALVESSGQHYPVEVQDLLFVERPHQEEHMSNAATVSLTFSQLTAEDASALLTAYRQIVSLPLTTVKVTAPIEVASEAPPSRGPAPPKVDPASVVVPVTPAAKAKPAATQAAPKASKAAAPPPADDEEEDEVEGDEADEDELAPELLNAKKLRDVLEHLMDKGITDVAELKAECARLKEAVPVLQRITDLEGRIDRTLAVLDMGAG